MAHDPHDAGGLRDRIAEAYRWQRALGNAVVEAGGCRIVSNPAIPMIWDANHADSLTAKTWSEFQSVLAEMDRHLPHCPDRMIHTDHQTPEACLAMLALADFGERPATIQMALTGAIAGRHEPLDLRPVQDETDWQALAGLVAADYAEGRRSGGDTFDRGVTDALVAGYRAKGAAYRFHLVIKDGAPVAYGAHATAPNGLGMIEDLFTLPGFRGRGIASALIAEFAGRMRAGGCDTLFLGALAGETAKHLYHRLGFAPVLLCRSWLRS